jgi:hypothetical protein
MVVFDKGLIVSIQKYSLSTTQELATICRNNGAVAIRTDQPIILDIPIIGLKKSDGEYYITSSKNDILEVSKWTNNIAIDSRKGNLELEYLYAVCHLMEINIIADIETVEDVQSVIDMCISKKIKLPAYFATTFDYNNKHKAITINEIKELTDIPIIAEGGYRDIQEIKDTFEMVNNICIGDAITGIANKVKLYAGVI